MKRIFGIFVATFATISLFANAQGHFFINVENENVQVANVESKLVQWLDLPANTTFTLFRDEIDNMGIRHLSYQQSVDGTEVANGMVLVHAKNDIVFVVNGAIMDATNAVSQLPKRIAPLKAAQKVRKKANPFDAQLKIIRVPSNGESIYRYAYEVMAEDHTAKLYVDAETGEIIKTKPLIYNADVPATAMTMYYGTQSITCYEDEELYYLHDEGRGIVTLNATDMYNPSDQYRLDDIYLTPDTPVTTALYEYLNDCAEITNPSTTWGGFWMMILESVTIDEVNQNSNWYSIGEGTADVYIKIKDNAGNVVFTSNRYDDPTFPVTFNIGMEVTTPPYSIEVWDYDPIGSDDLIETVVLEKIRGENKTYDCLDFKKCSNIVYLSCRIESLGRQPFLDAHWGMERTIDFYREKFNRNSYDNNGATIYQLLNHPSNGVGMLSSMYVNACAIGEYDPSIMIYGMGLISSKSEDVGNCTKPFVAIDVMAHEFTHLVTSNNGNGGLEYIGESGALNESFSDIMGISVKEYAVKNNDWLIGSDMMIYVSNMRSLKNPKNGEDGLVPQPDTYHGQFWEDTDAIKDHGGVHINSGVQNYWFYLLSEGGSGTNDNGNVYQVVGIGTDKAAQIAYRNLIYYLTPEATFEDARNGSIQAAIDLFGKDSQEHKSVMSAWYAVGVGEPDESSSESNRFVVLAQRNTSSNWFYMTSDLGTASNKRYQAVDAGTNNLANVSSTGLADKYYWEIEGNKLKNGSQYSTWVSGNTAIFDATGKNLTIQQQQDGTFTFSFTDGADTRYLALNSTAGNNYFAYYTGSSQIRNLVLLPYNEEPIPQTRDCKDIPYSETFAESQGEFTVQNVTMPSEFTSIWNWDSKYGMVAKCIKGSTKYESESYLISPCIELPENEPCVLTFSHAAKFFQSTSQMSLWISTDYDESDPEAGHWDRLVIPNYPTGANWNWFESGDIDLSAYGGQGVNIAFCYTSTTSYAPQWEIKNFEVKTSSATLIESVQLTQASATKVFRNGQLFILRDGKTYTVQGQEVR